MNHLLKLRTSSGFKWVSLILHENLLKPSKTQFLDCSKSPHFVRTPSFCTSSELDVIKTQILEEISKTSIRNLAQKRNSWIRCLAQTAMLEYFHNTRNLPFLDAEHMSKNSPCYLDKVIKKVGDDEDISKSLVKYFRYHPPNEFEPFFESLGLNPSVFRKLLPCNLLYLYDDEVLMRNYNVLCEYGFARVNLGKIYMEAMDIFRWGDGVLLSKLKAYEEMGLIRTSVIKVVGCTPSILVGSGNGDVVAVLKALTSLGFDDNWIEGCFSESNSYNWRRILGSIQFFSEIICSEEEFVKFLKKCPRYFFNGSECNFLTLIIMLSKCGVTMMEMSSLLLQFPQDRTEIFLKNLRQGLYFFIEIGMEPEDIKRIVCSHLVLLGSSSMKKKKRHTLKILLNVGNKRLREIVKKDPHQVENWVIGKKIVPLPKSDEFQKSLAEKTKFLLNMGFTKDSVEMETMFKAVKGRGGELEERLECYIKAGLSRKVASQIVTRFPKSINQSKQVIEEKLDFLVNGLGYPISTLESFPGYIAFGLPRVKRRFSMHNWLKAEGKRNGVAEPKLHISAIITTSETVFVEKYVKSHPNGLKIWEKLKNGIDIDTNTTKGDKPTTKEDKPNFTQHGRGAKGERQIFGKFWTDVMAKRLIAVVSCVEGNMGFYGTEVKHVDKWKIVSDVMKEKGCLVSPHQCKDKFYDIKKKCMWLHKILGRETSFSVVENPLLLDSMPDLSTKMKDEVRQLLCSKNLVYKELFAYYKKMECMTLKEEDT
ncbi:hypothetical protein GIB67_010392 [Kingdonia uniflora]|uniref:Myb/SANT-like DNA-binding domain-containing protein n=1 Tax=Kingdonia uniflora TaxID=39325 RepID=A0A7J7MAP2_9MAGN|nr:hypothetical protein GIB67_010392 [Kingdonia uniflora]